MVNWPSLLNKTNFTKLKTLLPLSRLKWNYNHKREVTIYSNLGLESMHCRIGSRQIKNTKQNKHVQKKNWHLEKPEKLLSICRRGTFKPSTSICQNNKTRKLTPRQGIIAQHLKENLLQYGLKGTERHSYVNILLRNFYIPECKTPFPFSFHTLSIGYILFIQSWVNRNSYWFKYFPSKY